MLLRNLDTPKLCNGTILVIKNVYSNILEAIVLTECATGEEVFIPRIPLIVTYYLHLLSTYTKISIFIDLIFENLIGE